MRILHILTITIMFILISCSGESGFYGPDGSIDSGNDTENDISNNNNNNDIQDVDDDADADTSPVCGNGVLEEGEVCDDGNNISGDGCNASCHLNDSVDFVVNTRFIGRQSDPLLVKSTTEDATIMAIFVDWSMWDGSESGIIARFFATDGSPGDEIIVNEIKTFDQYAPAAVVYENNVFIVWVNEFTGTDIHNGIRGKIIDFNGDDIVPEFQIDEFDDGDDIQPSVSVSSDGRFFVTWVSTSGTGGASMIGRFFDLQGIPQMNGVTNTTGEFPLPVNSSGLQINPSLQYMASSDSFAITWEDYSLTNDLDSPGISTSVLAVNGTVSATQFATNSITTGKQATPAVLLTDNNNIYCWIDDSHQFDPWVWGIHCRIFDTLFAPVTDDFLATVNTDSSQLSPTIAIVDSGFIVIWEDWSALDGNGSSIRARIFDFTGSPVTGEFGINSTKKGHQTSPAVLKVNDFYWFAYEDSSRLLPDTEETSVRIRILKKSLLSD